MSDESGAFRIGQVLATSYGVFARYFLLFFVLAFIANAPGLVLDLVSPAQAPPWLAAPAPGATAPAAAAGAVSPWLALPLIVLGLVLSFALSAAATYIVIADLRGTRFSLGEALGGGVRALPALIGMMLLLFLLFLGFALVIGLAWAVLALAIVGDAKTPYAAVLIPVFAVPVVIVGLKLSLAVPVIVAERAGAIQSMKRSSELTDRRLWQLFGLFALAGLILFVINAALFAAVAGVLGMPAFFSPVATLARHAIIAAEIPFYWAIVAVSYYYLRLASERSAVTVA